MPFSLTKASSAFPSVIRCPTALDDVYGGVLCSKEVQHDFRK